MKTLKVVKKDTDNLTVGFFDEDDSYVDLEDATEEELAEIAKRKDIIPMLIQALVNLAREIRKDTVGSDLNALWERLDKIENAG